MRFRRLVTIMLTLSVVASLMALPVAAIDYSDVVAPLYIGLEDVTADLAISSNGYASCEGSASVRDNYTVTVVVELQQKNGTWKTIKTWTEQGGVDAFVKGSYRVASKYSQRKIDIDAEGYEPIPEIRKWLEKYPVPARLAPEITEIEMDGGSEIYTQLCPFWDGEDGAFDLNTITEAELRQFPNLKHITLMSSKPEQVLPVLERCGIKVDLL